jgi:hypothetical protein
MISDPILKEKWRVQKKLSKKADYDVNKLIEETHKSIAKIKKEFNVNFKYSKRKGGYIEKVPFPLFVSDKK